MHSSFAHTLLVFHSSFCVPANIIFIEPPGSRMTGSAFAVAPSSHFSCADTRCADVNTRFVLKNTINKLISVCRFHGRHSIYV
uniref:Putative secreted peptide n=1 Tax=Anopheles braziliensis TaxID=58242 RepID=A0A2M3ZMZ8_9DIPT